MFDDCRSYVRDHPSRIVLILTCSLDYCTAQHPRRLMDWREFTHVVRGAQYEDNMYMQLRVKLHELEPFRPSGRPEKHR